MNSLCSFAFATKTLRHEDAQRKIPAAPGFYIHLKKVFIKVR